MTTKKTYQQLRQELDEVLDKLQQPDCDVDAAVTLYQQGRKLAADLQASLQLAENKVSKL